MRLKFKKYAHTVFMFEFYAKKPSNFFANFESNMWCSIWNRLFCKNKSIQIWWIAVSFGNFDKVHWFRKRQRTGFQWNVFRSILQSTAIVDAVQKCQLRQLCWLRDVFLEVMFLNVFIGNKKQHKVILLFKCSWLIAESENKQK